VATGDLNGDGFTDVAVGAWFEDAGGLDRSGRAYIRWGPTYSTVTTLEPATPTYYGAFGQGLAIGDLDGDGIDDLVVGEGNGEPPPPLAPGRLNLFKGGAHFATVPALVSTSLGTGDSYQIFSRAMSSADFNDDGYDDVAVGIPTTAVLGINKAGQVEVYWGPDFASATALTAPQVTESGFLGDRLSAADVNGDGIADLIVGAPRQKLGGLIAMGRVFIFTGPALQHFKTIDHPLPDGANSRFANAVVGCDLNADGIDDVISTDQRNHAFIFWSPTFDTYTVVSRPPDPVSGTAVAVSFGYFSTAGDVNGDGWGDVLVTEPFADGGAGRVYAAFGPHYSNFLVLADKVMQAPAEFGWGLYLADLDFDNRLELLVGSDLATSSGVLGAGHVSVFSFEP
jgi:hypothetical protein